MRRPIVTSVFALAAIAWACGEQLPDSGGETGGPTDGGDDGSALVEDGAANDGTSDVFLDGGGGDPCPAPPGFCAPFDTLTGWMSSEEEGGVVSNTTDSPKEGTGALRGKASGGSGMGKAAATKVVSGDFKSVDCTMWLRAPDGWAVGSFDALSLEMLDAGGFQQWRVSLGVAGGNVVVTVGTLDDGGIPANPSSVGGLITGQPNEWSFAHLAFSSADGWNVTGAIGTTTTTLSAPPRPTAVHDPVIAAGLSRAVYASTSSSFALDVDDLRCTIAK